MELINKKSTIPLKELGNNDSPYQNISSNG
jgi:hypothetical protein